jgi:hypothetical protein
MARTRLTTHKSTSRQPTDQLTPQDVPQPQEPHHCSPLHASQEEEPFEIKLVVPGSPTAQAIAGPRRQQQR